MDQLRLNPIKESHKPVGAGGVTGRPQLPTIGGAAIGKDFDHGLGLGLF